MSKTYYQKSRDKVLSKAKQKNTMKVMENY